MSIDSTGKPVRVGSKVQFRGKPYTIKSFGELTGSCDTAIIEFEEEQHTPEVADEVSIDLLEY